MMADPAHLTLAQIEAMRAGARVAVRTCMGIGASDRVFVLTDNVTGGIGRLLAEEAAEAGGEVLARHLEHYCERPVLTFPDDLRHELRKFRPTVSFYAASSQPGEVSFRTALRTYLLSELKVRHGHMPGVTKQLMMEGMRADYRIVAAVTTAVYDMARMASTLRVVTEDGTDLTVEADPALRWVSCTGIYHEAGQWGNLPEGETFTCPGSAKGSVVAHVIGDFFSAKYGILDRPVTFIIRDGRVAEVQADHPALADELNAYLDSSPNGRRVGEFAIGTNIGLKKLTGNLLQDEKIPGAHVAFGNPYPAETGAGWSASVHVDVIPVRCTITIDGETVMREGRFDYELLGVSPRG